MRGGPGDRDRLARRAAVDPADGRARLNWLRARAQTEGPEVFLEALYDRRRWRSESAAVQDLAISEAGRVLGPGFRHAFTTRYECAGEGHRIATFHHENSGIEFNLLPGGRFVMGSDTADADESPAHEVLIGRPFLIGRFPLRQTEWDRIGGEDRRHWTGDDLPIEGVSWDGAQDWLGRADARFRLPSESEWEYACRAGSRGTYFWGEEGGHRYAWYDVRSGGRTRQVHEHVDRTNAFGLVDIVGNVWEWCQDGWLPDYGGGPFDEAPRGPDSELRVARGGSWDFGEMACRSSLRLKFRPSLSDLEIGLRLCCDLAPSGAGGR